MAFTIILAVVAGLTLPGMSAVPHHVYANVVLDFIRFCRQISTSSLKLLECQRAQLVQVTVPADSIVETLNVIKHI